MSAKKAELLPIYLFIGEDKLKRDTLLDRMEKRIGELGDLALNTSSFDGPQIETPDVVPASCNTVPFLSEKRLVVVKDVEHAKKAVLDAIADYVEDPMESTVLVMSGEKLAKNTRLYKAVAKHYPKGFIACDLKKKPSEIREFVQKLAAGRGITISPAAAEHLVALVGSSTVALDSEMRKLADYLEASGRTAIETGDVSRLVTRTTEPKPWDVANALSERDTGKCLSLLDDIAERTPQAMLSICVGRIRELLTVKALGRRPGAEPIEKVLGGQEWMYRNHRRYASSFSERELIEALGKAAECEKKMKSGSNPDLVLELWVAGVCTGVWAL